MGKPTIEELEKLIQEGGPGSIHLNPDGSLSVAVCQSCADLRRERDKISRQLGSLLDGLEVIEKTLAAFRKDFGRYVKEQGR